MRCIPRRAIAIALGLGVAGALLLWVWARGGPATYRLAASYERPKDLLQELVLSVSCSPDGQRLLVASQGKQAAVLFDADTGSEIWSAREGRWTASTAISPDGACFALGSGEGCVTVWDALTFRKTADLPADAERSPVSALCFTPDGQHILLGDWEGRIRRWDFTAGSTAVTLAAHPPRVTCLLMMPGGSQFASVAEGGTAAIRDISSGAAVREFQGPFYSAAISSDGSMLLGGRSTEAVVIRTRDGETLSSMSRHDGEVAAVAFLDGAARAVSGDREGNVILWEPLTGHPIQTLTKLDTVRCIAVRPGSQDIVAGLHSFSPGTSRETPDFWADSPAEVPEDYAGAEITPVVHVSGRRFVDAALVVKHHWDLGVHAKFRSVRTGDAATMRDRCARAIVSRAEELGVDAAGLKAFLDHRMREWARTPAIIEGREDGEAPREVAAASEMPLVPCYADRIVLWRTPVWAVVGNWELSRFGTLGHVVIFIIDPETGEIITFGSCG